MSSSNSKLKICEQNDLHEELRKIHDDLECILNENHERKYYVKRINDKEETSLTEFIEFYKSTWLDGVQKAVNTGNSVFPVIGGAVGGLVAASIGYLSINTVFDMYKNEKFERMLKKAYKDDQYVIEEDLDNIIQILKYDIDLKFKEMIEQEALKYLKEKYPNQ
ncbi:2090_t:CDS:2, partial [Cetraspora pellucida]